LRISIWIDTDADPSDVLEQAQAAQKNIVEELETYGWTSTYTDENVTVDDE
tara:strand:- start:1164 stop:1316 length:153 start_codon:yes stop_codon:yes gene_type:complete